MASHQDVDHNKRSEILKELMYKAEVLSDLGKNRLQQGDVLEEHTIEGMRLRKLKDDEHAVARISIGGHPEIEPSQYCNFRGDKRHCIELLERALFGLKSTLGLIVVVLGCLFITNPLLAECPGLWNSYRIVGQRAEPLVVAALPIRSRDIEVRSEREVQELAEVPVFFARLESFDFTSDATTPELAILQDDSKPSSSVAAPAPVPAAAPVVANNSNGGGTFQTTVQTIPQAAPVVWATQNTPAVGAASNGGYTQYQAPDVQYQAQYQPPPVNVQWTQPGPQMAVQATTAAPATWNQATRRQRCGRFLPRLRGAWGTGG